MSSNVYQQAGQITVKIYLDFVPYTKRLNNLAFENMKKRNLNTSREYCG